MPTKAELEEEIKVLNQVLKAFGIAEDPRVPAEIINVDFPIDTQFGSTYRVGDRVFVRLYGGVR